MLLSLNWLKDFVNTGVDLDALAHGLTMAGIEVEEIIQVGSEWDNVIVAEITEVEPHPNADKLSLTLVSTGAEELPVVCGAKNISRGMKIALARPGAKLPNGMEIKKSKIRGQMSHGMICSEPELGLGNDATGIMPLSNDLVPGTPLADALDLRDTILDLGITPNRSDCLSVAGIAREVSAIFNVPYTVPKPSPAETGDPIENTVTVEVVIPDHCPRYAMRLVENVNICQSPLWMRRRLENSGIRAINNVVDITNYILLEWGQPMHAFDLDLITDNRITVRSAMDNESFVTLDENERKLPDGTVMICDGKEPVAIGGIMGGLKSGISDKTTAVLLESAYFDPSAIARTGRAINLKTEASLRFEKGVDINTIIPALDRAADLVVTLAHGSLAKGRIDAHAKNPNIPEKIILSVSRASQTLGLALSSREMKQILNKLGMDTVETSADTLQVTPPSYRYDINRDIDLVEEIARIHGYDNIPVTFPKSVLTAKQANPQLQFTGKLKEIAVSLGYFEVINYSFIAPEHIRAINIDHSDPRTDPVELLNPLSADQSVMRTTLLPGLLLNLKHNNNNHISNIRFFEIGHVFTKTGNGSGIDETKKIAGLLSGIRNNENWSLKNENTDFFDIKGTVETFLARLHIHDMTFTLKPGEPYLHPSKSLGINVNHQKIGSFGEIHPDVIENFELENSAYLFEMDFDRLLKHASNNPAYTPFSRNPAIYRDLAMLVNREITAETIIQTIRTFKNKLITDIKIFDFYQGNNIDKDKKSLAFRIKFHSDQRTLTDKEVNKIRDKLVSYLYTELGIELRI